MQVSVGTARDTTSTGREVSTAGIAMGMLQQRARMAERGVEGGNTDEEAPVPGCEKRVCCFRVPLST